MKIIRPRISKRKYASQSKQNSRSGAEELDDISYSTWPTRNAEMIANLRAVGLPRPGEQKRLYTTKSFNAIGFLSLIAEGGGVVEETYIAIYAIDYASGCLLDDMVSRGLLGKVYFLISNLRNTAHREKERILMERLARNPSIRLLFAGSHAKLIACRTRDGGHYVVEGSGNFAANSRIENYIFENCEQSFNFIKNELFGQLDKIATAKEFAMVDFNKDGQK